MFKDTSVIICCAGMGTRLGIGTTKALISINNKPLILHQLEQMNEIDDVRVVVGYQAEKVIETVNSYRKDVKTTGTLESVSRAMRTAREYTIVLGGDMFLHPKDFHDFIRVRGECIAFSRLRSSEPVFINMNKEKKVISFSGKEGLAEWSGLVKYKTKNFSKNYNYVYEMLESRLPMNAREIRSIDIDTPEDYEKAVIWATNGFSDKMLT